MKADDYAWRQFPVLTASLSCISTFGTYYNRLQLQETQLTISEIAYATGFSSPNYFSTSFKNKFGNSPKEYRGS